MVKPLTILGIVVIVFTSCGTLTPQETQQERFRLIEAYNEARERHNPEKIKEAVKDLLVGKWQYVGLEVEEGSVTAKQTTPMGPTGDKIAERLCKTGFGRGYEPTDNNVRRT